MELTFKSATSRVGMRYTTRSIDNRKIKHFHGPLTRYEKLLFTHAPGMPGTFSPSPNSKKTALVSDPDIRHGTCFRHVPWSMSGSLTHGGGENVPGIPGACATRNFTYLARSPWWRHDMDTLSANYWLLEDSPHTRYFLCSIACLVKNNKQSNCPGFEIPHRSSDVTVKTYLLKRKVDIACIF